MHGADPLFICARYPFTNNQTTPPMDWEQYVSEIASDIMKEQSPKRYCWQLIWIGYLIFSSCFYKLFFECPVLPLEVDMEFKTSGDLTLREGSCKFKRTIGFWVCYKNREKPIRLHIPSVAQWFGLETPMLKVSRSIPHARESRGFAFWVVLVSPGLTSAGYLSCVICELLYRSEDSILCASKG